MVNLDRDSLKYQVSRKDRKAYAKDAETAINRLILKEIDWWNLRENVVS